VILASTYYHHPVPGFIVTGIVCGACIVFAAWVWFKVGNPTSKSPKK
jgi:hypothetical protein